MTTLAAQRQMPMVRPHLVADGSAVELRELRYFASVARTGNVGRAAQDLGVSQSTISHQLRKLEDGLGTPLLVRHGRGVTLTPSGACLLERLDTIMPLLAAPLEHSAAPATMPGVLSVALPAESGPLLGPHLVARFRDRWPHVTLDIKEASGGALETWVLSRKVDVALVPDPPELDDLVVEPLVTEQLGAVVSPRGALAESMRPLRLRDLERVPLILPYPEHWVRRLLARVGFQCGVRLEPALQVDSVSLTKEMVRSGLGCGVLPAAAVREEIERGTLVFRGIDHPALAVTLAIVSRRASQNPAVADLVAVVREAIRSLVSDRAWPGAAAVKSTGQRSCVGDQSPTETAQPEAWRLPETFTHSEEYAAID